MVSWPTAFIAAIVAVIAFLQWVTALEKIVLDLFDKRFDIYAELRSAIAYQLRYSRVDDDSYFKFARAVFRAKFLFGPEVFSFLEERRVDLARFTVESTNQLIFEDEMVVLMNRLGSLYTDIDSIVLPYMQHTQQKLDWWKLIAKLTI